LYKGDATASWVKDTYRKGKKKKEKEKESSFAPLTT
jgi:hypothetical protein